MNKKVLIVDDSASIRAMVRITLEDAGYEIEEAPDGPEAIEFLEKTNDAPSLVLLDINMPKMSGLDAIIKIKQIRELRFTPIVMLTTESGSDKILKGKKAGASGWIVKPFDKDELIYTVNLLARKR